MLHVRVIASRGEAQQVLRLLEATEGATNVVHQPGHARQPKGDLISADIVREIASLLISDLRQLGVDRHGAITVIPIELTVSSEAARMQAGAPGFGGASVVWEEVAERTSEWTELNGAYLVFMALASIIAAVGLLTDSVVLIIGAMIVGPDFGPLAGICVGLITRRGQVALRSLAALAVGLLTAAAASWAFVELGLAAGLLPAAPEARILTEFVADPNRWSLVVALAAGIVGMLSLTTNKSGALVGVLVSVTTIPAAANAGLSTAYGQWHAVRGSLLQLLANVICIVLAGVATLVLERVIYDRRLAEHLRDAARPAAGG